MHPQATALLHTYQAISDVDHGAVVDEQPCGLVFLFCYSNVKWRLTHLDATTAPLSYTAIPTASTERHVQSSWRSRSSLGK